MLKSEEKKVITNIVTLNFGIFSKTTVQDGLALFSNDFEKGENFTKV